ncbi:hypothetical protein [Mucisphaera calidilacus]|uniref:Uncharacterized protein n=1 Tax=Mucisphaera calidilacus TaxID=2527982 RepID=A0A518C0G8_9BACT|nr:hypothetical protein [Mucisphaera calidilacus]QDU72709.1 hypothetical protein Pan265_25830 [Mucisphaera calidilacus]
MNPPPSSTSSSKRARGIRPRDALYCLAGAVLVVLAFDLTVASLFSIPADQPLPHGPLQRFFSYGQSSESKLQRTVGEPGTEPASIVRAGWIPTELYEPPDNWDTAPQRVAVYGMSFTNHIAKELQHNHPELAVMTRAGPGAPFNHSYAMIRADPHAAQASWVCVGILSSSLPYLQSMSGMSYALESPTPFAYPRFQAVDGTLQRIDPVIDNLDTFARAFRSRDALYLQHIDRLRQEDAFFNTLFYHASFLDRSAFLSLMRRAYGKRWIASRKAAIYNPRDGYQTDHPALAAVPLMIDNLHEQTTANQQQLLIILLHARGEPGHLDAWLSPHLEQRGIPTLSTTTLFDATDTLNFIGDGHYQPELDRTLAEALYALISNPSPD